MVEIPDDLKNENNDNPLTAEQVRGIVREEMASAIKDAFHNSVGDIVREVMGGVSDMIISATKDFLTQSAVETLVDRKIKGETAIIRRDTSQALQGMGEKVDQWIESVNGKIATLIPSVNRAEGMLSNFASTIDALNQRSNEQAQDISQLELVDRETAKTISGLETRTVEARLKLEQSTAEVKYIAVGNQKLLVGDKMIDGPKSVVSQLIDMNEQLSKNAVAIADSKQTATAELTALKVAVERSQLLQRFFRWFFGAIAGRYSGRGLGISVLGGGGLATVYEFISQNKEQVMKLFGSFFILIVMVVFFLSPIWGQEATPEFVSQGTIPAAFSVAEEIPVNIFTNDNAWLYSFIALLILFLAALVIFGVVIRQAIAALAIAAPEWAIELTKSIVTDFVNELVKFSDRTTTPLDDSITRAIRDEVLRIMQSVESASESSSDAGYIKMTSTGINAPLERPFTPPESMPSPPSPKSSL